MLPESQRILERKMREREFVHCDAGAVNFTQRIASRYDKAGIRRKMREEPAFEPVRKAGRIGGGIALLRDFVGIEKQDDYGLSFLMNSGAEFAVIAAKRLFDLRQQFLALAHVNLVVILRYQTNEIWEFPIAKICSNLLHDADTRTTFRMIKINQFRREHHAIRHRRARLLHPAEQLRFADAAVAAGMHVQHGQARRRQQRVKPR